MTQATLSAYGFAPEFRTLSICTTCLGLFDVPSLTQGTFQQQRCNCYRDRSEPRWYGPRDGSEDSMVQYDFNERARLCDCCVRYVLRSGSRWCVWFCKECKDRIISLNQEFGFAFIPIGRHSLMNRFGLRSGARPGDIERFVERFRDMGIRIGSLGSWKPQHLRGELERLGLVAKGDARPRAVPLVAYLRSVTEEDRTSEVDYRLLAFRELADRFEVREIIDPDAPIRGAWVDQ